MWISTSWFVFLLLFAAIVFWFCFCTIWMKRRLFRSTMGETGWENMLRGKPSCWNQVLVCAVERASVLTSYFICLALSIPWLNCRGSGAHFQERSLCVRGVKTVIFPRNRNPWLDPTGTFQSQQPFVIGFTELPGIHLTRKTTALTRHLTKGLSGPFMAQWRNRTSPAFFEDTVWKSPEFNIMYLFILLTHPVYKVTLTLTMSASLLGGTIVWMWNLSPLAHVWNAESTVCGIHYFESYGAHRRCKLAGRSRFLKTGFWRLYSPLVPPSLCFLVV